MWENLKQKSWNWKYNKWNEIHEQFSSKLDEAEERFNELRDRAKELTHKSSKKKKEEEENKKEGKGKIAQITVNIKQTNIHIIGSQKEKRGEDTMCLKHSPFPHLLDFVFYALYETSYFSQPWRITSVGHEP